MTTIVNAKGLFGTLEVHPVMKPSDITAWQAALADPLLPLDSTARQLIHSFLEVVCALPIVRAWTYTDVVENRHAPRHGEPQRQYKQEAAMAHAMMVTKGTGISHDKPNPHEDTAVLAAWAAPVAFEAFKAKATWTALCSAFDVMVAHTGVNLRWGDPHLQDNLPADIRPSFYGPNTRMANQTTWRHDAWRQDLMTILNWPAKQAKEQWVIRSGQDMTNLAVCAVVMGNGSFMGDNGESTTLDSARLFASATAASKTIGSRRLRGAVIVDLVVSLKGVNPASTSPAPAKLEEMLSQITRGILEDTVPDAPSPAPRASRPRL